MEDATIYYGILMSRSLVVSGIYLYRPICLVEGRIESINQNTLFIDSSSNQGFLMSTEGYSLNHDAIETVAYVIAKEQLIASYGPSIEDAKVKYFEKISNTSYLGFYISSKDAIQIVSYNFESAYVNINHDVMDFDDFKEENKKEIEGIVSNDQNQDFYNIPVSVIEAIMHAKSLEEVKQRLGEFYCGGNDIIDNKKNISIRTNIKSGDDIINLFTESYDCLLSINDMDVMKSLLQSLYRMYQDLYTDFENHKASYDDIEAARDMLLIFLDVYDRMLKMDSLEAIKDEIKKLQKSEEQHILEISIVYDERHLKQNENKELTLIDKKNLVESSSFSKEDEISKWLKQLHSLVGLNNIKAIIEKLVIYLEYVNRTKDIQNLENPNLNTVFKGNPGTGKTTVARILARLLYYLGYVEKDKFAEVSAQDLIAGYVGQTAIKTRKLLDDNNGDVIFIDEAYIMCNQSDSYAGEALVEILKEMEKRNTILIFAGYQKEMTNFINMNPGLLSRIGLSVDFEDYCLDELYQIFIEKLKRHNLVLHEDAVEIVRKIIDCQRVQKRFGNGRYIMNLFDKIIMNHALNCKGSDDIEILKTITVDDLYGVEDKAKEKIIGF